MVMIVQNWCHHQKSRRRRRRSNTWLSMDHPAIFLYTPNISQESLHAWKGSKGHQPTIFQPLFFQGYVWKTGAFSFNGSQNNTSINFRCWNLHPKKMNGWNLNKKFSPKRKSEKIIGSQTFNDFGVLSPSQPPPRGALKRRPKQSSFPRACKNGNGRGPTGFDGFWFHSSPVFGAVFLLRVVTGNVFVFLIFTWKKAKQIR